MDSDRYRKWSYVFCLLALFLLIFAPQYTSATIIIGAIYGATSDILKLLEKATQ